VHHVTVRTRDWARSLDFYQQVLGFTVKMAWQEYSGTMDARLAGDQPGNQRWAYLDSGDGTCIEIFEDPAFAPPAAASTDPTSNMGDAIVHFALRTSRIEQVYTHVRQLGATVAGSPVDYTLHTSTGQGAVVVRLFFIQGPSGEWIEVMQHAP
jgi:glyoxylase I family protein